MSATALTTFRPPHAVTMWCDDTRIFVELPAKSGAPYIVDFALSEAGLSKALNILKVQKRDKGSGKYKAPADPRIKTKPKAEGTEEQREKVRGILKKMGIT